MYECHAGYGKLPEQESCRIPFFSVFGSEQGGVPQEPGQAALHTLCSAFLVGPGCSEACPLGELVWPEASPWSFLGLILFI